MKYLGDTMNRMEFLKGFASIKPENSIKIAHNGLMHYKDIDIENVSLKEAANVLKMISELKRDIIQYGDKNNYHDTLVLIEEVKNKLKLKIRK